MKSEQLWSKAKAIGSCRHKDKTAKRSPKTSLTSARLNGFMPPSLAPQQDLRPLGDVMSRSYAFSIEAGRDFDHVVDVIVRELKKQAFGIVSDIDLQAIFKEKLAVDDNRYRIL
jgi:hypothetical protein